MSSWRGEIRQLTLIKIGHSRIQVEGNLIYVVNRVVTREGEILEYPALLFQRLILQKNTLINMAKE